MWRCLDIDAHYYINKLIFDGSINKTTHNDVTEQTINKDIFAKDAEPTSAITVGRKQQAIDLAIEKPADTRVRCLNNYSGIQNHPKDFDIGTMKLSITLFCYA